MHSTGPKSKETKHYIRRVEFRPVKFNVDRLIKELVQGGYNSIVSSGTCGNGYSLYPSKFFPPHPEMDPGYLPELIHKCHKEGIKIFSWASFNIQDVNDPAKYQPAALYPDWVMKTIEETGSNDRAGVGMCVLSSPYTGVLSGFAKELLQMGFDGVWFDGFNLITMPDWSAGCVCNYCREKFFNETGHIIPQKEDWESQAFKEWVNWRYRTLKQSAHTVASAIYEENPDAFVCFNTATWPWGPLDWKWGTALMHYDGGGASQHTGTGTTNGIQRYGLSAKLAKAISPRYADVWQPVYSTREDRICRLIPPHGLTMRMAAYTAVANGVTPWYGFECKPDIQGPLPDCPSVLADVMKEIEKIEGYFGGDEVKYCGVVISENTRNFCRYPDVSRQKEYKMNIVGIYSMLNQSHLPYSVVFDDDLLDDELKKYRLLILPGAACLSKKACERLKEYVRDGGVLVSTYETSLYDEWGNKLEDFGLAELFGVSYVKEEALEEEEMEGDILMGFRKKNPGSKAAQGEEAVKMKWENVMDGEIIEFGGPTTFVTASGAAHTGVNLDLSGMESTGINKNGIFFNAYGKGCSVYISYDIGQGYYKWPYHSSIELIQKAARAYAPFDIQIEAPGIVSSNIFKKDGNIFVHLVNLPAATNRVVDFNPGGLDIGQRTVVDRIIPVDEIRVVLRDSNVLDARMLVSGLAVEMKKDQNTTVCILPKVGEYDVLFIQSKS